MTEPMGGCQVCGMRNKMTFASPYVLFWSFDSSESWAEVREDTIFPAHYHYHHHRLDHPQTITLPHPSSPPPSPPPASTPGQATYRMYIYVHYLFHSSLSGTWNCAVNFQEVRAPVFSELARERAPDR
jgi:hypothetical protein